jgi:hypothetical protein
LTSPPCAIALPLTVRSASMTFFSVSSVVHTP